eukprot:scaffold19445_cov62-Phaeocystis_antarctica.AAC.1
MGPVGLWCTVLDVWLSGEQRSLPPSQKPVEAWRGGAPTTLNDQRRMPCRCGRTMAAAQSPRPRPARPRREPKTVLVPSSSSETPRARETAMPAFMTCAASLARAGFLTSAVCQPILRYHPNLRHPRHPRHPAGLLL